MSGITLKQARTMLPELTARLLDIRSEDLAVRDWNKDADDAMPAARMQAEGALPSAGRVFQPDLVLDTGWLKLVMVWRSTSGAANILLAIRQLTRHWPTGTIPVLVVPFMGETGSRLCAAEGDSWLDLSGNAHLMGPGLMIRVEGKANRYRPRGRPASVFAPRSARVARLLLMDTERVLTQKELAEETGLDAGFVSRIARQLEQAGLVTRVGRSLRCASGPDLLTAWRDAADFSANRVIKGKIGTIVGEKLFVGAFRKISEALRDYEADYLATGLGAVHLLAGFSGFSQAVFYLREEPSAQLLDWLSFKEAPGDGNVWLVVPKDDGVFTGAVEVEGLRCAHPAQVYVDLQGMPGRVEKAGEMVWERCLGF